MRVYDILYSDHRMKYKLKKYILNHFLGNINTSCRTVDDYVTLYRNTTMVKVINDSHYHQYKLLV